MVEAARVTIGVTLDGNRVPAEAHALGEETGALMGAEHNKAFNDKVGNNYSDLYTDLQDKIKASAQKSGKAYGTTFDQALRDSVKADANKLNRDLVDIFSHEDGIENFRKGLGDLGQGFDGVNSTADELLRRVETLNDLNKISAKRYADLKARIEDYRSSAGAAALAEEAIANAAKDTQAAMGKLADQYLPDFALKMRDASDKTKVLAEHDLPELRDRVREVFNKDAGGLDGFVKRLTTGKGAVGDISSALEDARLKLTRLHAAGGIADNDFKTLNGVIDDFAKNLGNMGKGLDDAAKKASGFGGKLGAVGGQAQIIAAIVALVAAALAPLAVLLSAAAAQTVIFGTVAAGALVGLGALALAFEGITKSLDTFPAAAQPGIKAIQDITGHIEGTGAKAHLAGGELQTLQSILRVSIFGGGFGPDLERMEKVVFPLLNTGAKSVGNSIRGIIEQFANGVSSKGGVKLFSDLLSGLAPIITGVGKIALSAGASIAKIFDLALPFAKEMVTNLLDMTTKFQGFVDSVAGSKAITDWFKQSDVVFSHIGPLVAAVAKGIASLVTPETVKLLNEFLDQVTAAVPSLSAFILALAPISNVVSAAFSLIFQVLAPLNPALAALFKGVNSLVQGLTDLLGPALAEIVVIIAPFIQALGVVLDIMGRILQAFGPVFTGALKEVENALKPVTDLISNVLNIALQNTNIVLTALQPVFKALGSVMAAVGNVFAALATAIINTLDPLATYHSSTKGLTDFLNGDGKTAIANFAGKLNDFAKFINDTVVPYVKTKLIPAFETFVNDTVPKIVAAVGKIISGFGDLIPIIGDFAKAFALDMAAIAADVQPVLDAVQTMGKVFADNIKGIDDLIHGNFAGAMKDQAKAVADAASGSVKSLGDTVKAHQANSAAAKASSQAISDAESKLPAAVKKVSDGFGDLTTAIKKVPSGANVTVTSNVDAITAKFQALYGAILQTGKAASTAPAGISINARGAVLPKFNAPGGIINTAQYVDPWNIAGEAGNEAIVPLNRPLTEVDPSVKALAAFAKYGPAAFQQNSGAYIAPGAIQIITPAEDPAIVASQVIDRLVPHL